MRFIGLAILIVFSANASARWWFQRPCDEYLRNEPVDMRASRIIDKDVFEEGLDLYQNSNLDIVPRKGGHISMRVGTSFYIDGEQGFTIKETEIGVFILSLNKKPIMKIEVSGDIAFGFHYDEGKWKEFARFDR